MDLKLSRKKQMKRRIKILPYCISYLRYKTLMFGLNISWNKYDCEGVASRALDFEIRFLSFGIGVRFVYNHFE